jgi:signal transduction histidine kinase
MAQSQRLKQLIEMMIDVAYFQQGQISIEQRPLDLTELVRHLLADFSASLTRHTIQLSGVEQPLMVDGDTQRLQQALQNVLQNAVKYSPRGGEIRVSLLRQESEACIQVQDQGIGVPATAQSAVFERFYRADNFNHLQISGFGIGLYMAREIIELHGGRINVKSNDDTGSTFEICLPLAA